MPQRNIFARFFHATWRLVDVLRRMAHIVFLALFFGVIGVALLASGSSRIIIIADQNTLVLAPEGMVVEQYSIDAAERALGRLMDEDLPETLMRDLLRGIKLASNDKRITRMVIDTDYLWGIGPAMLQELATAVDDFKASGKPVIAFGHGMAQHQYFLSTLADEIWLHPEGIVLLEGYGVYRNYYKEGLDKLAVDVNLFRVGEYKSAAEPYIRNDMSDYSRESNRYWLDSLWGQYLDRVAANRGMEASQLADHIDHFADELREAGGRASEAALAAGLVDRLATLDEFRTHLIDSGVYDEDLDSFRQIELKTYLAGHRQSHQDSNDAVAVVVAQGAIIAGDQPQGTVGGESTSRLIRQARNDKSIKALVLRVDSPGGGTLPSEQIRREIELTRAAGKPVVVSMSTVAASGGYWIAMSADEIWANPATITGSIGIYGLLTNFPRTLEKIGIHTDGVGTTRLAGALRADRELQPEVADIIQQIIEDGYEQFIGKVAQARDMTSEAVDRIARGRVWSGQQAHDRGLVDQLGGLAGAISAAAKRADLDDYRVSYIEKEPSTFEQLLLDVTARFPGMIGGRRDSLLSLVQQPLPTDLKLLLEQPRNSPVGIYAYCFCGL